MDGKRYGMLPRPSPMSCARHRYAEPERDRGVRSDYAGKFCDRRRHAEHAFRRELRLRSAEGRGTGLLAEGSAESDLVRAIHAVAEGKSYFSPAVSKALLEDYVRKLQRAGVEDSFELLTSREREILQLVAEGKSNKEVAHLLNLSVYTVETHRSNLMQKLNLRGVPELILYAVRKGIIS